MCLFERNVSMICGSPYNTPSLSSQPADCTEQVETCHEGSHAASHVPDPCLSAGWSRAAAFAVTVLLLFFITPHITYSAGRH